MQEGLRDFTALTRGIQGLPEARQFRTVGPLKVGVPQEVWF